MIYVIGDTQIKPNVRNALEVVAHHIADVQPKYVIHLGDHWDLPSLSYWDKGKKSHRPKTYMKDMQAGNKAMVDFWKLLLHLWPEALEECKFIFLKGNHEERRTKAIEFCDDVYIDLLESIDFNLKHWEVVPFLKIKKVEGIEFAHFFAHANSSKAIGSARHLLNKRHVTCIAGHQQGFDYAEQLQGSNKTIQSIIMGSTYYHDEGYKTHNNHHWRGTLLIHQTKTKTGFDFSRFSLETLDILYKDGLHDTKEV